MKKNKTLKANRLPLGKFLAWKSSDITSAGVFLIVTTYMTMFCTDHLGMNPLTVGNIILISNIIDFLLIWLLHMLLTIPRRNWVRHVLMN
jgi:Na+/melibiose symporter-like transporter